MALDVKNFFDITSSKRGTRTSLMDKALDHVSVGRRILGGVFNKKKKKSKSRDLVEFAQARRSIVDQGDFSERTKQELHSLLDVAEGRTTSDLGARNVGAQSFVSLLGEAQSGTSRKIRSRRFLEEQQRLKRETLGSVNPFSILGGRARRG